VRQPAPHAGVALALSLVLSALAVHAGTALERQVDATPAPHQQLDASGKPVTVHYAHLKDDYQDSPTQKAIRAQIKQAVAVCVEGRQRLGLPAKPPAAFPDQVLHAHEFAYAAPNRAIRYFVSYTVQMAEDCSLREVVGTKAELLSSKGQCTIDLDHKSARGVCDPTGHADAPVPAPRPGRARYEQNMAALAADPRMAAQVAALQKLTAAAPAGAQRTIAGFPCDMTALPGGIQDCRSRAGSFVPAAQGGRGLVLFRAVGKDTLTAVDAKFDMPVNADIFAPYAKGGYAINSGAGK
jgi:hypothetical protein